MDNFVQRIEEAFGLALEGYLGAFERSLGYLFRTYCHTRLAGKNFDDFREESYIRAALAQLELAQNLIVGVQRGLLKEDTDYKTPMLLAVQYANVARFDISERFAEIDGLLNETDLERKVA